MNRQYGRTLQDVVTTLGAADVLPLGAARLRVLQGRQHEQVAALVEARLPEPDLVHDAVAKR